ncbi:MAG TPA: ATP-binding protein [Aggregatilineales bacterium]|nr:ATP-binding protein [Aggregatilineales bacterium]
MSGVQGTKRETRQLEVLVQVAQLIATLDLDEVLMQTLELTTEVVGASKGSFFLLDGETGELQRFIAARDMDDEKRSVVSHSVLQSGLAGWVFQNKREALIQDTAVDDRWLKLDDNLRVRSAICVPVFVDNDVRGVMTLEHGEPNGFSEDDLRLAKIVVNQAGSALHNAQLFERVRTQQHQLEAVLDSTSEALIAVDSQWRIRLMNASAEGLLEVAAEDAHNKRLDQLSSKPLFVRAVETLSSLHMSAGTKSFEVRDESARKDYVVSASVLREDDHSDVGFVLAFYDITPLKDLNRLKTHMIKMASHDLKNPLGLILGYVDLIGSDVNMKKVPETMYIEGMYKAITRMETLIASLLDARRAEENAFASGPIDPYELIQGVLDDMLPAAQQRNEEVIRNIQFDLHPIKGDFVQLREAMNNLVGNAIKYTPEGGTITIKVYIEEDRFYFAVEDSGPGIPEDEQENIFKPYFRASNVLNVEGSGVGLSLVREVIEQHGGHPWFISELDKGSTFGFWLPLLDVPTLS